MRIDPDQPVQVKEFIGSYTSMTKRSLPGSQGDRILEDLGLDPGTFVSVPTDPATEADHLYILRHTLMNPWQLDGPDGVSYIERYWEYLGRVIEEELAAHHG